MPEYDVLNGLIFRYIPHSRVFEHRHIYAKGEIRRWAEWVLRVSEDLRSYLEREAQDDLTRRRHVAQSQGLSGKTYHDYVYQNENPDRKGLPF
jgi:hypothetical protein